MGCRTYLYARRSSDEDDRQTLSLDAQEKECRTYAEHHGIAIDEVVRESHSARRPGRPLFEAMLQDAKRRCEEGGAIRILCHKPDRLLRNIADWARINDLTDAGAELRFVTGSYANDAQGKMAFGINVVFAKYYVDNLSEEVRKGLREKIARGEWPGRAPLGYRNVRERGAAARIMLDPVTAPLVRRAFEYYATGEYSLASLALKLWDDGLAGCTGGRRLTKGYLQERILKNPFYCGLLRYKGQVHPASHPPLITTELFERVQATMRSASRPRRVRHRFRYSGLLKCGACGGAVVGDIKKGRYRYYRCSHRRGPCREGYVREEVLDHQLREHVRRRIGLSPEAIESLRMAARRIIPASLGQEEKPTWERQLALIEKKRGALLDLRLGGYVNDEEFTRKREEMALAEAHAKERLAAFEPLLLTPEEAVECFVRACNGVGAVFDGGGDDRIREFLRIVGSNYRLQGGRVDFEPVTPFHLGLMGQDRPLWCPGEDDVRKITSEVQAALPDLEAVAG